MDANTTLNDYENDFDLNKFIKSVKEMRSWQSKFFRTRDKKDLMIAKSKEQIVDYFIDKYLALNGQGRIYDKTDTKKKIKEATNEYDFFNLLNTNETIA